MEINNLEPVKADNQFVYKRVVKVSEEYDKFVFETIKPYCEKRMRQEISKDELIEALQKQMIPMKPKSKVRHGENGQIQHWCKACMDMLHGKPKYCSNCGQKVDWT